MGTCGFCGAVGVSKEHLWAGWLAATVLESRAPTRDKTFQTQIERGGAIKTFPNRDLELTVKMPCEPCNNGWMSDLENDVAVKPTAFGYTLGLELAGEPILLELQKNVDVLVDKAARLEAWLLSQGWQRVPDEQIAPF